MSSDHDDEPVEPGGLLRMSADVVASYLLNNPVATSAIPGLIRTVHASFAGLDRPAAAPVALERPRPAVPVGRSVQHEFIVCLEDGKRLKMLKRYLRSKFNLSPDDYRRRWGLPPEYPMVAPAYAARRSAFAKEIGLGRGVRRKSARAPRGK